MNETSRDRPTNPEPSGGCALCGRERELTFHHLIPRKLHRRNGFRRRHSRQDLGRGIQLCRLCHNGIHNLYDEMTLGTQLNTLQGLQRDPAIRRHVEWARKQRR